MNYVDSSNSGLQVRIETLDNVVRDGKTVNLLKIDVEGYEKFVLAGAARVLNLTECVHFEVFEANYSRFGYTTADVLKQISNAGFSIFKISAPDRCQGLAPDFKADQCENLIAVKDVDLLRSRTGWKISR